LANSNRELEDGTSLPSWNNTFEVVVEVADSVTLGQGLVTALKGHEDAGEGGVGDGSLLDIGGPRP
jgi:hypothetical protein